MKKMVLACLGGLTVVLAGFVVWDKCPGGPCVGTSGNGKYRVAVLRSLATFAEETDEGKYKVTDELAFTEGKIGWGTACHPVYVTDDGQAFFIISSHVQTEGPRMIFYRKAEKGGKPQFKTYTDAEAGIDPKVLGRSKSHVDLPAISLDGASGWLKVGGMRFSVKDASLIMEKAATLDLSTPEKAWESIRKALQSGDEVKIKEVTTEDGLKSLKNDWPVDYKMLAGLSIDKWSVSQDGEYANFAWRRGPRGGGGIQLRKTDQGWKLNGAAFSLLR